MIEAWHWLAFGMVLILIELFVPTFSILWFGLGATIVALILWVFPELGFDAQLFIWSAASIMFTILWFRVFKRYAKDRTLAGMAKEAIQGQIGQVVQLPFGEQHGVARFTTPLLGNDEWPFILLKKDGGASATEDNTDTSQAAEQPSGEEIPLQTGDKIIVNGISGNTLLVYKK